MGGVPSKHPIAAVSKMCGTSAYSLRVCFLLVLIGPFLPPTARTWFTVSFLHFYEMLVDGINFRKARLDLLSVLGKKLNDGFFVHLLATWMQVVDNGV